MRRRPDGKFAASALGQRVQRHNAWMALDVHDRIENAGGIESRLGRLLLWWLFDSSLFLWCFFYSLVNAGMFCYGMIVNWDGDDAPYFPYAKGGDCVGQSVCAAPRPVSRANETSSVFPRSSPRATQPPRASKKKTEHEHTTTKTKTTPQPQAAARCSTSTARSSCCRCAATC